MKINLSERAVFLSKTCFIYSVSLVFAVPIIFSALQKNAYADPQVTIVEITKGLSVGVANHSFVVNASHALEAHESLLQDPPRYVLDIPGFTFPRPVIRTLAGDTFFKALRAASHDTYTRIVFDLQAAPANPPTLRISGNIIEVSFTEIGVLPQQVSPAPTVAVTVMVTRILPTAAATTTPIPTLTPTTLPTATATQLPTLTFTATPLIPKPTVVATPEAKNAPNNDKEVLPLIKPVQDTNSLAIPTIAHAETAPVAKVSEPEKPVTVTKEEAATVSLEAPNIDLRFAISALVVNFPFEDRPIRDVTVKSRSKGSLFMTVTAGKIIDPGLPSQQRVVGNELLVSPRRFELHEGEERTVRMVLATRDAKKESVFRVNFVPDSASFSADAGDGTKVDITTGLAALVIASPQIAHPELVPTWSADRLVLQNNGNINIFLDRLRACRGGQCTDMASKRLYPGVNWEVPAAGITSIKFLKTEGNDFENVVFTKPK